jgi:class 3 adenylate cyclase
MQWKPDYEIGIDRAVAATFGDLIADTWATPETIMLPVFAPSQVGDADTLRWLMRLQRAAATPRTIKQLTELNLEIDVRGVAGSVRCPTLVLQADGDLLNQPSHSQWLADHIPGARYASYASTDHIPVFDGVEQSVGFIEAFVAGELGPGPVDRVLSTVLFADIVDSSRDRAVLDRHNNAVHREVRRHRGTVIPGTGDGVLATFDSPARAIRCAHAAIEAARSLGLNLRAGIHTGELELRGDGVAGIAVQIGSRVAGLAGPGEVLASSAVPPLVFGSEITFTDRGSHGLEGVPGEWHVLATSLPTAR